MDPHEDPGRVGLWVAGRASRHGHRDLGGEVPVQSGRVGRRGDARSGGGRGHGRSAARAGLAGAAPVCGAGSAARTRPIPRLSGCDNSSASPRDGGRCGLGPGESHSRELSRRCHSRETRWHPPRHSGTIPAGRRDFRVIWRRTKPTPAGLGGQVVAGSNPVSPTNKTARQRRFLEKSRDCLSEGVTPTRTPTKICQLLRPLGVFEIFPQKPCDEVFRLE